MKTRVIQEEPDEPEPPADASPDPRRQALAPEPPIGPAPEKED